MKCHYCGVETTHIFCHHCGTRQQPARKTEEEVWQPFQSGELIHEPPESPNYCFFDEDKRTGEAQTEEPEVPAAVSEPELPVRPAAAPSPGIQLPTGRSLVKMLFLGLLTLGIYPTVIWSRMATELNITASRYDGERTMPLFAMILLTPLTLGIYMLVWYHGFCRRIGAELSRRNIPYRFGAAHFWLWNVLGMLILVGPFIFVHKLTKSMNLINQDFNVNG